MSRFNQLQLKKSCVIVIPVHSATPSYYELISFKQCFEVLNEHPIYVLAPAELDLSRYHQVVNEFELINVSKKWMSSRLHYNKLKLSHFFYEYFQDYEFMLTYELDAFIFKDDLDYWCSKEYDYIGAPWFEDNDPKQNKIYGPGNSGFSLRRISAIKEGIRHIHLFAPRYETVKKQVFFQKYKSAIMDVILAISSLRSLFYRENRSIQDADFMIEEDTVIVNQMPARLKNFKLAPIDDAYKFSFEVGPEVLFNLNQNCLPTGCHAWWRYNLNFWKPYIENFGYRL
jgi:hypothetical protein